jgi:hypothetical protein
MRCFTFLLSLAAALSLAVSDAGAGASTIAVGEVTPPPPSFGVDRATLKRAAEGEIEKIDVSRLPSRRVVVSLALVRASDAPVACTINAMLRDGRTGAMIAIMESSASADGGTPQDVDLRKAVAATAVRSVVRQIPNALK